MCWRNRKSGGMRKPLIPPDGHRLECAPKKADSFRGIHSMGVRVASSVRPLQAAAEPGRWTPIGLSQPATTGASALPVAVSDSEPHRPQRVYELRACFPGLCGYAPCVSS